MKDLKYLLAYLLPLTCALALWRPEQFAYSSVIFAFILIPLLEFIFKGNDRNIPETEEPSRAQMPYFDVLLLLNIPIVYGLVGWYIYTVSVQTLSTAQLIGLSLSTGIMLGSCGINVAHELGHRSSGTLQFLSKLLLLPSLYQHFFIEHNRGHHKYVGTPSDPATARLNEILYFFWLRSTSSSWVHAWRLERDRLQKDGTPFWSWHNEMIRFSVVQLAYLAFLYTIGGPTAVLAGVTVGLISIFLLETINYIEHYGLMRKPLASGRYEPVTPVHSWNSDHEMGRILLYELTRHSDHHYKATRKYQILRHLPESPQLPLGYPGSMLLALFPPLWFTIMNPLAKKAMAK